MSEIPTPRCPVCGTDPYMVMGGGTQAFCGNDGCEVFTWNPAHSREAFLRDAKRIDLEVEDGIIRVRNDGSKRNAEDAPSRPDAPSVALPIELRPPERAAGLEPATPVASVAQDAADEPWWCDCPDRKGSHVHMPNWSGQGGSIMLTALVDVETGKEIPGSRKAGYDR